MLNIQAMAHHGTITCQLLTSYLCSIYLTTKSSVAPHPVCQPHLSAGTSSRCHGSGPQAARITTTTTSANVNPDVTKRKCTDTDNGCSPTRAHKPAQLTERSSQQHNNTRSSLGNISTYRRRRLTPQPGPTWSPSWFNQTLKHHYPKNRTTP